MKLSTNTKRLLFAVVSVAMLVLLFQGGTALSQTNSGQHLMPGQGMMQSSDMGCEMGGCANAVSDDACANHCLFSISALPTTNATLPTSTILLAVAAALVALAFPVAERTLQPVQSFRYLNRIQLLSVMKLE